MKLFERCGELFPGYTGDNRRRYEVDVFGVKAKIEELNGVAKAVFEPGESEDWKCFTGEGDEALLCAIDWVRSKYKCRADELADVIAWKEK